MVNVAESTKKSGKRYEVSLYDDELIEKTHDRVVKNQSEEKPALFYLGYVGQIGLVIALPIAGCIGLGSYLDGKWQTYPKMTLIGLGLGLVISIVNFVSVIKEIIKGAKN